MKTAESQGARLPVWRASLENAFTHELQGSETLNDLFEFLEQQTASASQARDAER